LKVAAGDQGAHHPVEEPEQRIRWVDALNGRPGRHNADAATNANLGAVMDMTRCISRGSRPLASSPGVVMRRRAEGELIWARPPRRSMSLLRR
jgi:hypothetical protein